MRIAVIACLLLVATTARADLTPEQVIQKVLESDPWGLSGAEVAAHAVLTDKRGANSLLSFSARSRRYDGPLAKSLVRFVAPADLANAGFLLVQKRTGDDDRFLYLTDIKKSRRIAGNLRANAFMGTDFSFADLDRLDLRDSKATPRPDESVGKLACYHLDVQPRRGDSQYSRIEVWVRKDNFLPLKSLFYDKANVLIKTLTSSEMKRVSGRWFITKSRLTNHAESHTTDLVLDKVIPRDDIADEEFTVRALEKA
jgi:hypothetical protein